MSYRKHFTDGGAGLTYDQAQYAPGAYWDLLWRLEQGRLNDLLERLPKPATGLAYLDFACGTGRVLVFLEGRVASATGVDVSWEMLRVAREKVRRANLIQQDITASEAVERTYDLITAFRFVLNAEPSLRAAALSALARRLNGKDARLVLNCHGNRWSYKALKAPWLAWRRARGAAGENLLSSMEVERLCQRAGLRVIERFGMGVLPAVVLRLLPGRAAERLERLLMRVPLVWRLGVNQFFVCGLRER